MKLDVMLNKLQLNRLNHIALIIGLSIVFSFTLTDQNVKAQHKKEHSILVSHPGNTKILSRLTLHETTHELRSLFSADVVSVYCSDSVCKIDTVRLFWNEFGNYIRYQLPESIDLEKAEGKKFSQDDYNKLQGILSNKYSPFAKLNINDVVKRNDVDHGMEVDVYTGATILELEEDETVNGASLTCYTLWHWANGDVVITIQTIFGDRLSVPQFISYLESDKKQERIFAFEQIIRKKLAQESIREAVESQSYTNKELVEIDLRIKYLELLPEDDYVQSLLLLLPKGSQYERIKLLKSISRSDIKLSITHLNKLSKTLKLFHSYREIDLLLNSLEKQESTEESIEVVFGLLKKDNILISRRAYWFLKYTNYSFSSKQKKRLKKFYKKYEDYL